MFIYVIIFIVASSVAEVPSTVQVRLVPAHLQERYSAVVLFPVLQLPSTYG